MAKDRFKTTHNNPLRGWLAIGVLLALVLALLAAYVLRPGRSPADNAQTAAAIVEMDAAQNDADRRRDEQRSSAALLN